MAESGYTLSREAVERIADMVRLSERRPLNGPFPQRRRHVTGRPAASRPPIVWGHLDSALEPLGCARITLARPIRGACAEPDATYDDTFVPCPQYEIDGYFGAVVWSADPGVCLDAGTLVWAQPMPSEAEDGTTYWVWVVTGAFCDQGCDDSSSSGSGSDDGDGDAGDDGDGGGSTGTPGPCGVTCVVRWTGSGWCLVSEDCAGTPCYCAYDEPDPGMIGFEIEVGCREFGTPLLACPGA